MKSLLVAGLCLFFVSCASQPKNPDAFENLNEFSSIAFFSPNLPIDIKSPKPRQNKALSGDIGPWGLPHILSSELSAQLKVQNKNYIELNVDQSKIDEGVNIARDLKDFYLGDRFQVLANYLQAEAHGQGVKNLIVVHPVKAAEYPDYKNGFGLICSTAKDAKAQLMGYALIRADVWSVAERRLVKRITITPNEAFFNTGKSCPETRNLSLEKITTAYQQEFISLAKKTAGLIVEKIK